MKYTGAVRLLVLIVASLILTLVVTGCGDSSASVSGYQRTQVSDDLWIIELDLEGTTVDNQKMDNDMVFEWDPVENRLLRGENMMGSFNIEDSGWNPGLSGHPLASQKASLIYRQPPMEELLTLELNVYESVPGSLEGYANGDMKRNGIPTAFDRGTFTIKPVEELELNPWWYLKKNSWSYWYHLSRRFGEKINFPDNVDTAKEKLEYIAENSWVYTYQLAQDAYRLGDYEATLPYYDELISRHPDSPLFYQDKAVSLCLLQRFDEGEEVRDKLLELSGETGLTYNAAHAYEYISLLSGDLDGTLDVVDEGIRNGIFTFDLASSEEESDRYSIYPVIGKYLIAAYLADDAGRVNKALDACAASASSSYSFAGRKIPTGLGTRIAVYVGLLYDSAAYGARQEEIRALRNEFIDYAVAARSSQNFWDAYWNSFRPLLAMGAMDEAMGTLGALGDKKKSDWYFLAGLQNFFVALREDSVDPFMNFSDSNALLTPLHYAQFMESLLQLPGLAEKREYYRNVMNVLYEQFGLPPRL